MFENNTAGFQGGAIVTNGTNVSILGNNFENNVAGLSGGAISDGSLGNVTIAKNTFSGDMAPQGQEIILSGNQTSINGDPSQADWITLLVNANKNLTSDEIVIF